MTDELPEIFNALKPPPAPPGLRPRVLAAVERELARRRKPRWERALEWGVAACLALGVGLNAWQWRNVGGWNSPRDTSLPVAAGHRDLVEAVASITDEATARMIVDGLVTTAGRRPDE